MTLTLVEHPDTARRLRLRDAINRMAAAIEAGAYTPTRVELERVIEMCQEQFLPVEAARVMRWMTP